MDNGLYFIKKNFSLISISLIMFLFIFFLTKDTILSGDDIWLGFYGDWKYIFLTPEHGRFLQSIQMKTFCYWLPSLFNVHPNALSLIHSAIISINITAVCFISTLYGYIGRKKTKLVSLFAFGTFIFYVKLLMEGDIVQEIRLLSFNFAYVFGLLMFLAFWLIFGEIIFSNKELSQKNIILCSIFAFLASLNDTYSYIGVITIFSAFCFVSYKIFKQIKEKHNFWEPIKAFCKKYIGYITILLTYLIGSTITILTTFEDSTTRFCDENFAYTFSNFFKLFLPQFTQACILQHLILVIPLIILAIVIFFTSKNREKILVPTSCLLIGVLGFFLMLFFGGTEKFYEAGKFWVWRSDLQTTLIMIFLSVDFALFGFLFSETKHPKILKTIAGILLCSTIALVPNFASKYKFNINQNKPAKQQMYMSEKIYLFYAYKKETAILPISSLKHYIASNFYLFTYFYDNGEIPESINGEYSDTDILEIPNYPNREEYKRIEQKTKNLTFSQTWFRNVYIDAIYKISKKDSVPYKFDDDNAALKKFHDMGGRFTAEELQQLNFTKLKDKNFVLNTKNEE